MRKDCEYDIVMEMDYPLGVSTELAYDTWGKDIHSKVNGRLGDLFNNRTSRTGSHLKIAVRAHSGRWVSTLIGILFDAVHPQAGADMTVRIHELEPAAPKPVETMSIEEVL